MMRCNVDVSTVRNIIRRVCRAVVFFLCGDWRW
jgi:hypothetical protein